MPDAISLVSLEHTLLKSLFEASQKFSSASSTTSRQQGYVDLLNALCEYITNRYPNLMIEESLKPINAVTNDPLSFLDMHLDLLQREAPLSTDFLRWLLTKLIMTTGSVYLTPELVANIRKYCRDFLSKLLPEEERMPFILNIIEQLREQIKLEVISLWEDDAAVIQCFVADKDIELDKASPQERENIIASTTELLTAATFPIKDLSEYHQCVIWNSTIEMFSTGSTAMRTSVLRTWNCLIANDAANYITCRLAVDRLLQLEVLQKQIVPSFEQAKVVFFETLQEALIHFDKRTSMLEIDLRSVIYWGETAASIFLQTPTKRDIMLQFARTACQVLATVDLNEEDVGLLANLQLSSAKIVSFFFRKYRDNVTDVYLEPFVSLLLHTCDPEAKENWIRYVAEDHASSSDLEKLILSKKFISVLQRCNTEAARSCLEKLAPTRDSIIKFVEDANRQSDFQLLLTLISIIGDLAIAECISPIISLPFLSIPWFSNETILSSAMNRRHHQSIPALKDFTKFASFIKKLPKEMDAEVRFSSIAPLTKISKHNEWRRHLYTTALKDRNPKVAEKALNHLPEFLTSIGTASFQILSDAALESTSVTRDVIMSSLARCICILDTQPDDSFPNHSCDICRGSGRQIDLRGKRLESFPESVLRLILDKLSNPSSTSLGSLKLACSVIFHYPLVIPKNRLKDTLVFMANCEEAVREQNLHLFKQIITTCDKPIISQLLQEKLPFYQSKMDDIALDPFSAKYLTICAMYAKNQELSNWAFGKHYSIILQNQECEFLTSMRNLVRDIGSLEDMATSRVFARRIRTITRELCSHLISFGRVSTPVGFSESVAEEVMSALELTRKMFFFEDIAAMLKIGARYIVPSLLMCSFDERPWTMIVLENIREAMSMSKEQFGHDFFPHFMVQWILQKGPNFTESDSRFITSTCGAPINQLSTAKRYVITQLLLQVISTNPKTVSEGLTKLNASHIGLQPFSITKIMLISCEYVGHFLKLRWCLTVDDFYEQRSVLIQSLDHIIQRVEPQFLDDVANRLMSVLRAATQCGEAAIPVWISFALRLEKNTFKALLPRILIDTQPLLQYDSSDALISVILGSGSHGSKPKTDVGSAQDALERENIVSTTFVLIGCDINGSMRLQKYLETMRERDRPVMTHDKLIHTCVNLLTAECETVGRVVLQKLNSLLDGNPVKEELSSAVIPALFQTLRRCSDPETRALTVKCLGRLGAVDPGRLDIAYTDSANETTVFVDDKNNFLVDLIERSWKAYSRETEFAMFEQIEYSIQELLTRVVEKSDEHGILDRLSVPCRKDIWPLKSTQLSPRVEPKWTAPSPVVTNVEEFSTWLQQCFVMGANRVRQEPIRHVFRALKWIANTRDTLFTRYILPQLILRLIIENDTEVLDMYIVEMETVLHHVVECGQSWVQLAAHIVFSILDTLEQFAKYRKNKKKGNSDPELNRTLEMLKTVAAKTMPDGQLLIVVAAEKCNCFYRALKWCEQYAVPQNGPIERQSFFTLERIYTSLNNVDGVLGAFECLSKNSPPMANERILALEAAGDYHEAMALYALCGPRNEPEMVKCLLRLNQPQLALCTATSAYNQYRNDENMSDILYANQVEAACLLQDWKQLDNLVEKRDPLTLGKRTTWGASCASILCAVKRQEPDILTRRLQLAREILVDQLTAMTIEHSDTYTQAYNYITQLHILDEIEDSSAALNLVSKKERGSSRDLKMTLDKWQARSENAIQGAASLESILSVRRELLKLYSPAETKSNISQCLIQSCRLARQAEHLQIAWTFLVEAQSLNVNHKDVGMEQARFEFQKGDQQQAISLLTKLLNGRFETMTGLFQKFVLYVETAGRASDGSTDILKTSKEERASFAEVQLLRAEYMMKAGAVSSSDLYRIYMALRKINVPSEDLFYRVALFCDGLCQSDNTKVRTDLVIVILKTYADALRFGRNHLFHAMPRMLTLWLDFTQKKHDEIISKLPDVGGATAVSESNQKDKNDIMSMNGEMMNIFRSLDTYYFYKAYPQLISRIEHKSELVFTTLKTILAELLIKYPHQCLWLSIAVYRSGAYDKDPRQKRCNSILQVAKTKDKRLEKLIDQYDYISQCLIQIAEKKNNNFGTHNNLGDTYPQLYDYFTKGIMDTQYLMGAKERKLSGLRKELPTIMVPLTEMMDYAIPKNTPHQVESFSQIVIDTAPSEPAMGALPEVLIQKFENNYMVLKSMMQPKRLTIRSQDGRIFHIMAKPSDELRKDARFMDVNRMMNSLMRQNPESRRRQLAVRTFTVIPLQSHGGILEWLPNLIGYRHALQPLFDEKVEKKMTDSDWFKNWDNLANVEDKLKRMQNFYKYYPLVMAEWFRREFVDPSSWHSARSNYARSTAVMSVIGFVLGLGDRHGENILLDQKDGCVVHVDFNLIFNKGEQLPVKEIVPFRLTRNMVNGLGPTGVEGVFRKSCEATLKLMREHKETLHTVIQAFVHDPLLEWQNAKGAQQNRARQRGGQPAAAGELAADAVALIGKRLEGHIVTPEIFKWKFGMTPMNLEGQVNKLIEIATDDRQLVQMYIGWAPFM